MHEEVVVLLKIYSITASEVPDLIHILACVLHDAIYGAVQE